MTRLRLCFFSMSEELGTKVTIATQTAGINSFLWVWQLYLT